MTSPHKDHPRARYKPINRSPQLLTVDLARQLLPGSFADALGYVIDHELERSAFGQRYRNDDGGAPAYAPALLLKRILWADARGQVSSRARVKSLSSCKPA